MDLILNLSVFTSNGDQKGIKRAIAMCKQFGIKMDSRFIIEIMRGYLNLNKPHKVLNLYDEYMIKKQGEQKFNPIMLSMKCKAILQCIESESDEDRKCILYEEMESITKQHWNVNGFENGCCLLDAVIAVYGEKDPLRVKDTFEWMVNEGIVEYKRYKEALNGFVIDLHQFQSQRAASYVLRYCILHKLDELAPDEQDLKIVVGQGLHSKGKANKQGVMAEFVINELRSNGPPIESSIAKDNKGMLIVARSELVPYLSK